MKSHSLWMKFIDLAAKVSISSSLIIINPFFIYVHASLCQLSRLFLLGEPAIYSISYSIHPILHPSIYPFLPPEYT